MQLLAGKVARDQIIYRVCLAKCIVCNTIYVDAIGYLLLRPPLNLYVQHMHLFSVLYI